MWSINASMSVDPKESESSDNQGGSGFKESNDDMKMSGNDKVTLKESYVEMCFSL